jgi:hypothetical protein
MDATTRHATPPAPPGRFASLLLPEVAAVPGGGVWRVEQRGEAPYHGPCKARLRRSQYAVGESLPDGTLAVLWRWDVEDDLVLSDERVSP